MAGMDIPERLRSRACRAPLGSMRGLPRSRSRQALAPRFGRRTASSTASASSATSGSMPPCPAPQKAAPRRAAMAAMRPIRRSMRYFTSGAWPRPDPDWSPDKWTPHPAGAGIVRSGTSGDLYVVLKRDISADRGAPPRAMLRPTAARGTMTGACRSCSGARAMAAASRPADRDGRHHADLAAMIGLAVQPVRSTANA